MILEPSEVSLCACSLLFVFLLCVLLCFCGRLLDERNCFGGNAVFNFASLNFDWNKL